MATSIACALVAGLMVSSRPMLTALTVSLLVGPIIFLIVLQRTRTPIPLIVLVTGLVALPTLVRPMQVSLGGLITVGLAVLLVYYCLAASSHQSVIRPLDSIGVLFVIWALFSTLFSESISLAGVQNLSVYVVFFATILASRVHFEVGILQESVVNQVMIGMSLLAIAVYLGPRLLLGINESPRPFALVASVGVVWFASRWSNLWSVETMIITCLLLAVTISLSRTAIATALAAIVLSRIKWGSGRSLIRTGVFAIAGVVGAVFVIQLYEPLHSRFFTGDVSISVGGLSINAMGRISIWETTLHSWSASSSTRWIGQGAGSASAQIEAASPGIGHPHNDFLRILHDFGIPGLALWLLFTFLCLVQITMFWRRDVRSGNLSTTPTRRAGVIALILVLPPMLTDNVVIYYYAMIPTGVMVGLALAQNGAQNTATSSLPRSLDSVAELELKIRPIYLPREQSN